MSVPLYLVECDNIPGRISEENKVRMMVVSIVAMLVVTMVVAGWQHEEEQVEIEVDEGHGEATVIVPPPPEPTSYNESDRAVATSYIDEDLGYLQLDAGPENWNVGSTYKSMLSIDIEGDLSPDLDPEEIVLEAQVIDAPAIETNHNNWHTSHWEPEGLELWPRDRLNLGSVGEEESFIGAYIEENNFSTSVELANDHPTNYSLVDEPINIEFRAIILGLEEDVRATARVSFIQEEV